MKYIVFHLVKHASLHSHYFIRIIGTDSFFGIRSLVGGIYVGGSFTAFSCLKFITLFQNHVSSLMGAGLLHSSCCSVLP